MTTRSVITTKENRIAAGLKRLIAETHEYDQLLEKATWMENEDRKIRMVLSNEIRHKCKELYPKLGEI